jgi:hypothetical protein
MTEYIRGWRQLTAVYYLIRHCLLRKNWACARRELEIMSGFAKPYRVVFSSKFKESYKELFGEEFNEEDVI